MESISVFKKKKIFGGSEKYVSSTVHSLCNDLSSSSSYAFFILFAGFYELSLSINLYVMYETHLSDDDSIKYHREKIQYALWQANKTFFFF